MPGYHAAGWTSIPATNCIGRLSSSRHGPPHRWSSGAASSAAGSVRVHRGGSAPTAAAAMLRFSCWVLISSVVRGNSQHTAEQVEFFVHLVLPCFRCRLFVACVGAHSFRLPSVGLSHPLSSVLNVLISHFILCLAVGQFLFSALSSWCLCPCFGLPNCRCRLQ